MEFSVIAKELNAIQSNYICKVCNLTYPKKWTKHVCLFCTHFLPVRDTRYIILKECEWHFIKSGEDDHVQFYKEYMEYATKWCDRFHIPSKKEDKDLEKELI